MPTLFRIIGVAVVVAIVLILIGSMVWAPKLNALESEAGKFIDETIPLICNMWNVGMFLKYADSSLLEAIPQDRWERFFSDLALTFGYLVQYQGRRGGIRVGFTGATATYSVDAEFETGPATLSVSIRKRGNEWKITSFEIKNPPFRPEL